ncbi:hypothetical protein [Shouchella miscanthi]|uniref:Pycsar effector protein domain-containing protein n=1 Tax=Shouchella miscanthi TaxID=2598861 RepID=A0ABU6NPP1_9BACI|nr:hypothetical protein [Shouchella miscanthi]
MSEENTLSDSEVKEEAVQALDRINFWISNCDTKISFSLAFAGILLAGFFSSSMISGSLNKLLTGITEVDKVTPYYIFTTFFLMVFIVFMIVSLIYLFRGKKGSINPNVYKEKNLSVDSILFFGTIQKNLLINIKTV